MANASWLDPDGGLHVDEDERLMAPGSRRLWLEEVVALLSEVRSITRRTVMSREDAERLRRGALDFVEYSIGVHSPPQPDDIVVKADAELVGPRPWRHPVGDALGTDAPGLRAARAPGRRTMSAGRTQPVDKPIGGSAGRVTAKSGRKTRRG